MSKIFQTTMLLVAASCAGCAASPESIPASYASPVLYQNWSCAQLGEEQHRLSSACAAAAGRQDQARTNDAVGVFLIGLPMGSMSGQNVAPEIGRLKGEAEAVRRVATTKGCAPALSTASIPE